LAPWADTQIGLLPYWETIFTKGAGQVQCFADGGSFMVMFQSNVPPAHTSALKSAQRTVLTIPVGSVVVFDTDA
jgi:hypothetical protein